MTSQTTPPGNARFTRRWHGMSTTFYQTANGVRKEATISSRSLACAWKCQVIHDSDKISIKCSQIKLKEDGLGAAISKCLTKLALGSNLLNQLNRHANASMKHIARQATLGRLLIIGEKGLSLQKTIAAPKAAFGATKIHSASTEEKQERESYRDNSARQKLTTAKIDSYEEFSHPHANLPEEIYTTMRPPPH